MTIRSIGHGTTIDIDPDGGVTLLVVDENRCEPIYVRGLSSGRPSVPPAPREPKRPAFKKIRYAGAD